MKRNPDHHRRVDRLAHAIYGLIILTATVGELRLHEDALDTAIALVAAGAVVLVIAHSYSQMVASAATTEGMPETRVALTHLVDQLALAVPATVAVVVLALGQAGVYSEPTAYDLVLAGSFVALFVFGVAIGRHHNDNTALGVAIGVANMVVGALVIGAEIAAAH